MPTDREILGALGLINDEFEAREGLVEPKREPLVAYVRDLTEADLAALGRGPVAPARSLVRLHASHHALARCLATGMRPGQAALVTGYSASRISVLQNDPAFQALVRDYQSEAQTVFADLGERMYEFSLDAIELLHERLAAEPQTFTIPVLLDLIKGFADRTGHGPGQEVHIKMSRDVIDRPPRESFEDWEKRRTLELKPIKLN